MAICNLQIFGSNLEQVRDNLKGLTTCFGHCFHDRVADGIGDLAATSVEGKGGNVGITVDNFDLIGRNPIGFGSDQRKAGVGTTDVNRSDLYMEFAVTF